VSLLSSYTYYYTLIINSSISAALSNLLPPLNDSIGAQMLKKMGWKPGQGIGPRLTYDQLLKRHEVDGTPLPSMEHEEARKHTYAPRDTAVPVLKRKDDFGGLGYVPLAGLRTTKEVEGPKLSGEFQSLYPARWVLIRDFSWVRIGRIERCGGRRRRRV
jgi:hypothetical protein